VSLRFEQPIIYLITTGLAEDADLEDGRRRILDIIRIAVEEKISLIQIREKRLSARRLFELTAEAAAITRGSATRLLLNDRADIALAAKADGVHLKANSLPVAVTRNNFPKGFIVGVSTHTFEATANASRNGADFAVFAPVFDTPGKGEPHGLLALTEICKKLRPFPVIALGGIDETNYQSVLAAGATGIAAIRLLNDPASLLSIARKLRK
jgi:thiamine-phosphate pyrophosphorylase